MTPDDPRALAGAIFALMLLILVALALFGGITAIACAITGGCPS